MINVSRDKLSEVEMVKFSNNSSLGKFSSDKNGFKESCLISTLTTNGVLKKNNMKHSLVHFVNFYQF